MIKLYNEDCLKIMAQMPDKTVDLLYTDPPYDISATNGGGTVNKIKKLNKSLKELDEADITEGYDIEKFGEEFLRILKEPNIYLWCNKKQIPDYFNFYVNKHKCKFEIIKWSKCLHSSTYIIVKDKLNNIHYTSIKDIYRNCMDDISKVNVYDGNNWTPIINIIPQYDTKTYLTITLRNGNDIKCTKEHRFSVNGKLREANQLNVGEILDHTNLDILKNNKPCGLTKEMLWFIGHYIAEGNIRSNNEIGISTNKNKEWIADKIKTLCKQYNATISVYDNLKEGLSRTIVVRSKVIKGFIEEYVVGENAYNKHFTSKLYSLDKESLDIILQGYLDGDAHFEVSNNRYKLGFTKKNTMLYKDLCVICNILEYNYHFSKGKATYNGKKYGIFRGQIRKESKNAYASPYEIISIKEETNKLDSCFYDLSLDNENHLFALYDGVLSHNCNALPTYSNKYLSDTEYCLYFYKGKGKTFPQSYDDAKTYYFAPINHKDKKLYGHPTIKPLELVEKGIRNSSREDWIVFDPFMGSGTTGVACVNNGRNFIGVELNEEYFNIAKERIESN